MTKVLFETLKVYIVHSKTVICQILKYCIDLFPYDEKWKFL